MKSLRFLLGLSLAIAGVTFLTPPSQAAALDYIRISNERTRTWSAWVQRPAWVRAAPSRWARSLDVLGTSTFHGSPEVVLVLGEAVAGGHSWSKVRYPGLGARRGWVLTKVLSEFTLHSTRLVLDRSHMRLQLLRGGRVLFSTPVGVGAFGSPTPAGRYYVRERLGPFANANSIYGALAFGTSAFSPYRTDWPGGGQVGIHGTNEPGLIPGRISNGCVRLANTNVLGLGRLLRVGTPLLIK